MTKVLPNIQNQISTYFHMGILAHHLFISYYMTFLSGIEEFRNEDRHIQVMMDFSMFYLTGWNFCVQCIYFALSLGHDVFEMFDIFQEGKKCLEIVKNYIFRAIVFPLSMGICAKFWIIYSINPSLIFPVNPNLLEAFFPSWCNHALHTHIVTAGFIEILITCHHYSSEKFQRKEILANMTFSLLYVFCFIRVYFIYGIWLYPVYDVLSWPGRIALATTSILLASSFYKIGAYVSHIRWEYDIQITQDTHQMEQKKTH